MPFPVGEDQEIHTRGHVDGGLDALDGDPLAVTKEQLWSAFDDVKEAEQSLAK